VLIYIEGDKGAVLWDGIDLRTVEAILPDGRTFLLGSRYPTVISFDQIDATGEYLVVSDEKGRIRVTTGLRIKKVIKL